MSKREWEQLVFILQAFQTIKVKIRTIILFLEKPMNDIQPPKHKNIYIKDISQLHYEMILISDVISSLDTFTVPI